MLLDESAQNILGFLVIFCSYEAGILFQALQFVWTYLHKEHQISLLYLESFEYVQFVFPYLDPTHLV